MTSRREVLPGKEGLLLQIVYVSSSVYPMDESMHLDILETARTKNVQHNVTGVLVYHNSAFLQVIEGDEVVIENLFERICRDPRHSMIIELLRREVPERMFPTWAMGTIELEDDLSAANLLDSLMARAGESVNRDGADPAIETLLDTFRHVHG